MAEGVVHPKSFCELPLLDKPCCTYLVCSGKPCHYRPQIHCLEIARMINWFKHGDYPLHSHQASRRDGSWLNDFLAQSACPPRAVQRIDDARDFSDHAYMLLRMLLLAHHYEMTDLTRHCLGRIEASTRQKVESVWEIDSFGALYPTCAGDGGLNKI